MLPSPLRGKGKGCCCCCCFSKKKKSSDRSNLFLMAYFFYLRSLSSRKNRMLSSPPLKLSLTVFYLALSYCELSLSGGSWQLVRHIPSQSTWFSAKFDHYFILEFACKFQTKCPILIQSKLFLRDDIINAHFLISFLISRD